MYLLAYCHDGTFWVVQSDESLKEISKDLYRRLDPDEVEDLVGCTEVEEFLTLPVTLIHGCAFVRDLLSNLGIKFEPLTRFLIRKDLLDDELRSLIVSKSI